MGGMLLHEATFWLPDPVTLTNSSLVSWSDAGGSGNWSRFDNPRIDELHYKWRNSTDVEGRTKAYQEIQDILADAAANNSPLILIGRTVASSKRIIGVNFSQEPYSRYAYIKLKD
jgi:peptide/nickel transport system substrate-binding protein